ncbi:transcriptional regulator [Acidothermus cellulolyticus 11B]|uniref:Transcriptional regulator n=1 Tax=Acidothermus cellulolyticus (strain ATCC 43068 / DSM 8971 / 11B) TaxID=351607 RepID=A0LS64_ACIC1|nr:transcriptional regulator [Acidothermus cellulolyticus 11B]
MTVNLTDSAPPAVDSARRAAILDHLRAADRPLSITEIAEATGVHANTARFHLDRLVDEGLVSRSAEPRDTPGRPRILYAATATDPGPRSYALLAEMLTGLVASIEKSTDGARKTGRQWGQHLVERPAPSEQISTDEAVRRVNAVLDAIGFRPEMRKLDGETEFLLRHCPFREVALRHTDIVCALHRGLIEGAVGELHAPLEVMDLRPFVTPTLCTARLRRTDQRRRSSGTPADRRRRSSGTPKRSPKQPTETRPR